MDDDPKMYIFLNCDMNMSNDDVVSQCCHVTHLIVDELVRKCCNSFINDDINKNYILWNKHCTKIILKIQEIQLIELLKIENAKDFYDKNNRLAAVGFYPGTKLCHLDYVVEMEQYQSGLKTTLDNHDCKCPKNTLSKLMNIMHKSHNNDKHNFIVHSSPIVNHDMENKNIVIDNKNKIMLNDFEKIKLIGIGSAGHIYLVKQKNTDKLYAMKCFDKKYVEKNNKFKKIEMEIDVLKNINYQYISKLYYTFQSETQFCILMHYCAGGDLFKVFKSQPEKCLTEEQTKFYASEVLLALEYLHLKGYVHRDLKPENILIKHDGHILLSDFDLAEHSNTPVRTRVITKKFSGDFGFVSEPDIKMKAFVGTEGYLAPEILYGNTYNASVDWWSYGVLLYELCYGKTPFKNKLRNIDYDDYDVDYNDDHKRGGHISKSFISLIKGLLIIDPMVRLGTIGGATDIKDHSFFKDTHWQTLHNMEPPITPILSNQYDTKYFPNYDANDTIWDNNEIDITKIDNKWNSLQNIVMV